MAEQFKEGGPGVGLATVIAVATIALTLWVILVKLWAVTGGA